MVRNSENAYGWIAVALHWLTALAIGVMVTLGLVMTRGFDDDIMTKVALYQWHKSIGIVILALVVLRLGWRLANPVPRLPETLKAYERGLAHAAHMGLYGLMLAMPVSGWLLASASTFPTDLFGWAPLPKLIAPDQDVEETMAVVHEVLAWALLALLAVHVAAALKHHLVLKDDVLRRMLTFAAGHRNVGDRA